MNRSNGTRRIFIRTQFFILVVLGLTLFSFPAVAQVFDSGPSDPALFNAVVNVPEDVDGILYVMFGVPDDGSTAQINVSDGGSVGSGFEAGSGVEININAGTVGDVFSALSGSEVNISGGSLGVCFKSFPGSSVNLFGSDFVLDGVPLDDGLAVDDALTIVDRAVTLSGQLTDGSAFSFDLNPANDTEIDYFDPSATLTVTLTPATILGDCNFDGDVNFLDITPFIVALTSDTYQAEADCNLDGEVNTLDIASLIAILSGR